MTSENKNEIYQNLWDAAKPFYEASITRSPKQTNKKRQRKLQAISLMNIDANNKIPVIH